MGFGYFQVLSELYQFADLVLQLKFEVEVLLKLFDMKIEDIEPSQLIRKHDKDPSRLAAMFGLLPQAGENLASEMARLNIEQPQVLSISILCLNCHLRHLINRSSNYKHLDN